MADSTSLFTEKRDAGLTKEQLQEFMHMVPGFSLNGTFWVINGYGRTVEVTGQVYLDMIARGEKRELLSTNPDIKPEPITDDNPIADKGSNTFNPIIP